MVAAQLMVELESPPISQVKVNQHHGEADLGCNTLLVAAPGNGKTTALRKLYWLLLQNNPNADRVAVVTPTRASANSLRDLLAFDVERATRWPKARSIHSFAHHVMRTMFSGATAAALPTLLSGAQQQYLVDDLLAALSAAEVRQLGVSRKVLELRGFRQEVRDLLDVAQQHRLQPELLAGLLSNQTSMGVQLLSFVLETYRKRLESEKLLDSAALLNFATDLVSNDSATAAKLGIETLIVDDIQDVPPAGLELISAMARHARIHAFGDPDASVLGFRAASPDALHEQLLRWQAANSATSRLLISNEGKPRPTAIMQALQKISEQIPTSRVFQHRPRVSSSRPQDASDTSLVAASFDAAEAESRWLAAELRRIHFAEDIPWHEIAVVARSRAELARLESEFSNLSVPSRIIGQQLPLSSQPAAGALVDLVWHAIGGAADKDELIALVRSPILGLSAIALSRLTRQLREAHKLQTGELKPSFELLTAAISVPALGRELNTPEGDKVARIADVVHALRQNQYSGAHELVSEVWKLLNLAETWMKAARRSGPLGAAASRNLDSVIHLFAAARRFDDRNPEKPAIEFIRDQRELAIPEDAILPAVTDSRVALTTPSSLTGRPKVVVIPALQQGLWPNLKQRGSILGSAALDSYLRGRSEDSRTRTGEELADERRMLYRCVGAASEKVIITARDSLDESPSVFFNQLSELAANPSFDSDVMNLRQRVGLLRRQVLIQGDELAAAQLKLLAEEGVPGAHPSNWHNQLPLSTNSVSTSQLQVSVSASSLGSFEICPLHWFINTFGGSARSSEATLGTLVHKALESGSSSAEELWQVVESHWSELSFDSVWLENRTKREAKQKLLQLAAYLQTKSGELLESELKVIAELGDVRVFGRVDRLEAMPDGTIQVADIKTGKPPTANEAASSRQLQLYQLALATQSDGAKLSGAKIVAIETDDFKVLTQPTLSEDVVAELHRLANSFQAALAQPSLSASLTSHCLTDPGGCGLLLGGSLG